MVANSATEWEQLGVSIRRAHDMTIRDLREEVRRDVMLKELHAICLTSLTCRVSIGELAPSTSFENWKPGIMLRVVLKKLHWTQGNVWVEATPHEGAAAAAPAAAAAEAAVAPGAAAMAVAAAAVPAVAAPAVAAPASVAPAAPAVAAPALVAAAPAVTAAGAAPSSTAATAATPESVAPAAVARAVAAHEGAAAAAAPSASSADAAAMQNSSHTPPPPPIFVTVRDYENPALYFTMPVPPSWKEFIDSLRDLAEYTDSARLYYRSAGTRQPIVKLESAAGFAIFVKDGRRLQHCPDIYMLREAEKRSPEELPPTATVEGAAAAAVATASSSSSASLSSSSASTSSSSASTSSSSASSSAPATDFYGGRGGSIGLFSSPCRSYHNLGVQRKFHNAVFRRNPPPHCALCDRNSYLDAVSIIPQDHSRLFKNDDEREAVMVDAGLADVYDTCNGIVLCEECHHYFDAHLWSVDSKWKVVVTDALAAKSKKLCSFSGKQLFLDVPEGRRPLAGALAWHHRMLVRKAEARKEMAARYTYLCEKCSEEIALKEGVATCDWPVRTSLTPTCGKKAALGGGSGDGGGGSGRGGGDGGGGGGGLTALDRGFRTPMAPVPHLPFHGQIDTGPGSNGGS